MKGIAKTQTLLKALAQILILPLVFGLFWQASCSKESKIGPDEIDPIVGTWRMVLFNYDAEMTSGEVAGNITADGRDMDDVLITFKADGTTGTRSSWIRPSR